MGAWQAASAGRPCINLAEPNALQAAWQPPITSNRRREESAAQKSNNDIHRPSDIDNHRVVKPTERREAESCTSRENIAADCFGPNRRLMLAPSTPSAITRGISV